MTVFGRLLGLEPRAAEVTGQTSGTANPAQWLTDLFGGLVTSTGIRVSPELALTVPGLAASVNVISEDLAKVPLRVYQKTKSEEHRVAVEHPLHQRIHHSPAPWLTSFNWRRAAFAAAMSRGNHYSRVIRNVRGEVMRLQPIKPGRCSVRWTQDGEPFFDVMEGTYRVRMSYQDIIHLPYRADTAPGEFGGVLGVSPIARHAESISLAIAAERFASGFFKNGARPSVVVEMDRKLPNDHVARRIRDGIERAYGGLDNAFKVAILELGMKMREISFKPSDSQLVEVRKENAVAMCQIFGVPPHKVGILDRATFSNIEHQAIEYVTGPVSALAKAMESAIDIACLTTIEREQGYFVQFDLNGLLRGDIQSRYRAYAIGRQWGWLSADEIRAWENMDPLPLASGKTYLQPMNMQPSDKNVADDDETPPQRKVLALPAPEERESVILRPSGEPFRMRIAAQ